MQALRLYARFARPACKAAALLALAALPAAGASAGAAAIAPAVEAVQPSEIAPVLRLKAGKSSLLRMPQELARVSIGSTDVADVVMINSREIYFLGKRNGATNIFMWAKSGKVTVMDVIVGTDTTALREQLTLLLPGEAGIRVDAAGDAIVLSGQVANAVKVQRAVELAEQFGAKKVINMMSTAGAAQVMLEVKVAEVSKTLMEKLGTELTGARQAGNFSFSLLTGLLSQAASTLTIGQGATRLAIDAEAKKGLVKILAEPTIMAISGQEGAFLAGGRIFIPVAQANTGAGSTISLEEKEFGVGLKFLPTVLEGGLINLRVTPEVSELSQIGSPFTTVNGSTSILPSITTRRASTTVQLMDGQSFVIGGLIKNNINSAVKSLPLLGDIPVLGALFRSTEFQNDRTELLFIVTPHLVKPLEAGVALPTDHFSAPSRAEMMLFGKLEGDAAPAPRAQAPAQPASGLEIK
ncbi:MAG: type II and III secretion system protein family protein [Pseudomonadota bacterium]